MKITIRKETVGKRILQIITVLTPLLSVLLVLFITGHNCDFGILVPAWNDETGWFSQVAAMLEYGSPLGYYGYNGSHAAIGTFGPWGVAPLVPYYLFGSIFGWNLYSMTIANIFFLCCAIGIFILLTKPDCKQLVSIIIMYFCLNITIGYSMTSMSESLRYSVGICLLGLLIFLARHILPAEKFSVKQYIIIAAAGLFIFYAINVYLIFALALPVYLWIVFSKLNWKIRIPICVVGTLLIAFAANYLVSLVTAPYVSDSTLGSIASIFSQQGFYKGIVAMGNILFTNLQTVNLFSQSQNGETLAWFFFKYIAVIFYLLYKVFPLSRKNETNWFRFISLYLLLGFLIGYCLLYTGSNWTLCRGINTGFTLFLLLLCLHKELQLKKIIILLTLVSTMSNYSYFSSLLTEREASAAKLEPLETERKNISKVLTLNPEGTEWENTIACYGDSGVSILYLPVGMGLNSIFDGQSNKEAKYVLVTQGSREAILQKLLSGNHEIIYENKEFLLLVNKKYDY